ncbi:glycerol-3-phosphate dehydrogenase [NAD(P)+] [Alphaproteobacteria bacterium]|nr:glycerol-3-phosphate dehydrogenase [NAD(P)+] [Alphaproteobacteria bacterium]
MDNCYEKVVVVGAGCYGTAIAQCFGVRSKEVLLISDIPSIEESINNTRINKEAFPHAVLSDNISCTTDFYKSVDANIIFIAVPASAAELICRQIKEHCIQNPVVLCSKGLDVAGVRLMSDLAEEIIDNDIVVFSGPSFAHEVVRGLPFGVNIASKNRDISDEIVARLSNPNFTIKPIDDYIGLQIAGAFKNILAIGCGIFSGRKYGSNAIAKLIVDGVREMIDLTVAMGGKKDTFLELGGIGDTMLTCNSMQSRNVLFGEHISKGGSRHTWKGNLAEGAFSAKAVPLFEDKYQVPMKVFHWIHKTIYGPAPA